MDSPEAFEAPSSGLSRRQVLATGSVVALSGCLGGGGDSNRSSGAQENEDVANAPVPDSPSSLTYGTMGGGDRPTVTYYGNWKCPYCAQFSASFLGDLVTDYVESGDINLRFRALSYINGKPFLGPDAPELRVPDSQSGTSTPRRTGGTTSTSSPISHRRARRGRRPINSSRLPTPRV
jgi:hypothetical protein